MSASEKSNENPSSWNGSRTAPGGTATWSRKSQDSDAVEKPLHGVGESDEATAGKPAGLPAPVAEKALAVAQAVRGAGGRLLTVVRARTALVGGTAAATAAVLTGAYALGRRSGRRSFGPLTRLTGGRI